VSWLPLHITAAERTPGHEVSMEGGVGDGGVEEAGGAAIGDEDVRWAVVTVAHDQVFTARSQGVECREGTGQVQVVVIVVEARGWVDAPLLDAPSDVREGDAEAEVESQDRYPSRRRTGGSKGVVN
jgi:hypothetical protein